MNVWKQKKQSQEIGQLESEKDTLQASLDMLERL